MNIERLIERVLFASRWLLAPLYVGMAVLLVAFTVEFYREIVRIFTEVATAASSEVGLVLAALALIDMVLVAGLIVMVMLSGYENFVSKLDLEGTERSLAWLGKLDSGSLKIKVAASIVAISSIHLLKAFMNVQSIANDKLMWLVLMHLTFVASAMLLAYMDRLFPLHR
jgi:uncharacterized protein (TIGR00645 family)